MLENPPKAASFDHVDADGNLIFICENTPLSIQVDDTLERAIAESHQITRQNNDKNGEADNNATSTTATLPISQIQALIRAGVDPSHVAQRYNVSETQVRRFSAGVETEKQYAIEQFLLVPAPKQSNMRTLADLIERTLAKAHIGMETIKWRATRRGLEPWLITATFKTATRTIKAEWTWNMHDNSVTCANPSSRLLLGEDVNAAESAKQAPYGGAYRDTVSINFPFNSEELPGNSIRSARIERAVSQWELRNSDKLSEITPQTDENQDLQFEENKNESVKNSKKTSALKNAGAKNNNSEQTPLIGAEESSKKETHSPVQSALIDDSQAQKSLAAKVKEAEKADAAVAKSASDDANAVVNKTNADETSGVEQSQESNRAEKTSADHNKRRGGRAAVPSWDEILFGEG